MIIKLKKSKYEISSSQGVRTLYQPNYANVSHYKVVYVDLNLKSVNLINNLMKSSHIITKLSQVTKCFILSILRHRKSKTFSCSKSF